MCSNRIYIIVLMMEKIALPSVILLLLFSSVIGQTDDYFAGLNLDATLARQANLAINTLKNSLYLNFNCNPQQQPSFSPFNNPSASSFLQGGYQSLQMQGGYRWGGGFIGMQPQINCQNIYTRKAVLNLIYQQIVTVTTLLQTIKTYLLQYNNIILGSNNTVVGSDDFVIGSNNSLNGSNDWVFASDYQSTDPQNGVLILEVYLIELTALSQLTILPSQVVHCVQQDQSNRQFNNLWGKAGKNHRFSF